ncbi:MAG: hypothetical protein RMX68_012960 [Aulosira sp. ZfuVER01]|nr:hypothetical protein [Aulosira sp. ZfuVER01]MDZ8001056.1 hypothetical protein [Aulosira sp. DedVER01a]MDZ8056237.1 hypothetical protein [Aulosira sp. ZfuCHP01]
MDLQSILTSFQLYSVAADGERYQKFSEIRIQLAIAVMGDRLGIG